jgi:hypothetical protein
MLISPSLQWNDLDDKPFCVADNEGDDQRGAVPRIEAAMLMQHGCGRDYEWLLPQGIPAMSPVGSMSDYVYLRRFLHVT